MRERVEALGGRLNVGPQTGGGWRLRAELPVAAPTPVG
jgi:signal transduction histidine kinase